jgi:hypothetical protein
VSPFVAQALRRITSEGASTVSTDSSRTNTFTASSHSDSFHQPQFSTSHGLPKGDLKPYASLMSSLDAFLPNWIGLRPNRGGMDLDPVLDMLGMHTNASETETTPTKRKHAQLSLLTDLGRRYPGYPSALSPTFDAKQLFPSPGSEAGSGFATPRATTPVSSAIKSMNPTSPMSIGSPSMSGPSDSFSAHCAPDTGLSRRLEHEELLKAGIIMDKDMWNNDYQP